ncbi:hypothetical protein HYH03_000965 [Edaphochlamys debaryana]|uniref:GPI transamidase component PIG-T n=1 Tax=Edaphochlamys debaryana TaxID=47281 RepID=A0A835YE12_9CHLO|nr:hypothetical protein HYH03_000965 [Edaphochlamys debaryana]|eukprot:KAG2501150.1 hypothetical protein HYH03_000965 [Edaphochlamys debaryana]
MPKGSRVVPMTLAERRGRAEPPAIGVSRAMPRLQMYDTLDLLELKGFGLNLPLPPPPLEPLGSPPQPELPAAAAAPDAAAARAAARAVQAAAAALGPLALGPAQVTVDRYVTGTGLLRGGMVLEAAKQGGAKAVRLDQVVCVHQVFPWYVRPWLHSLVVQYDGKPEPLRSRLVAQSIRPAAQRASPGVLDVCLHVPPHVRSVVLQLAFTKAFLTAFEYPPDAHRGFDVPAAVVSYMDPLAAPELYTPGLLVPLAAPDFSIPYNVICLSSTLLAVYFGAGLKMLLGRKHSDAVDSKRRRRLVLLKLLQLIVLVVVFGGLARHLDHDLRAQVEGWARGAGLDCPRTPTWSCASGWRQRWRRSQPG